MIKRRECGGWLVTKLVDSYEGPGLVGETKPVVERPPNDCGCGSHNKCEGPFRRNRDLCELCSWLECLDLYTSSNERQQVEKIYVRARGRAVGVTGGELRLGRIGNRQRALLPTRSTVEGRSLEEVVGGGRGRRPEKSGTRVQETEWVELGEFKRGKGD